MIERVVLVHSDRGQEVDGIRDHTLSLAEELSGRSIEVDVRLDGSAARLQEMDKNSAFLLQYSPFCFARWGFAPWIPASMLAGKLQEDRPVVAVMVHEPYVPMNSWQWVLMGLWQRLQLRAIRLATDVTFASIEPWAARFRAEHPRQPVHHLPVGSNLPDERARRSDVRRKLRVDDGTFVIATMGSGHPSWLGGHVVAAANAAAATGGSVAVLCLGATAPQLSSITPAVTVHAPGYLAPADLAGCLAASDLFLAPLSDGVSTRRGTLMAALQHGLPIVGTSGHLTDPILRQEQAALLLVPVDQVESFASVAADLASRPELRVSMGTAGRALYERHFDWPVVADKLLAGLSIR